MLRRINTNSAYSKLLMNCTSGAIPCASTQFKPCSQNHQPQQLRNYSIANIRQLTQQQEENYKKEKQEEEDENSGNGENKKKKRSIWFELVFFGIPAAITFSLGVWQTRRLFWKKQLIAEREDRVSADPVPYDPKTFNLDDMLYRVISITGEFDHSREVLIGLRTSPDNRREYIATGRNPGGEMGYFIVTPLITPTGEIFWVNRGWIARPLMEQEKRPTTLVKGPVTIHCMVREEEELGKFADAHIKDNQWTVSKPSMFTKEHLADKKEKVVNVLLEQVDVEEDNTFQQVTLQKKSRFDMIEFFVMPEKHIGYMVTWYGLCSWVLATWAYIRRKKLTRKF